MEVEWAKALARAKCEHLAQMLAQSLIPEGT